VTQHAEQHVHTHADGSVHDGAHDLACAMAHGDLPPEVEPRTLVAVFAAPVSSFLMHFARDAGFRTVLVEPDQARVTDDIAANADGVASTVDPSFADERADIVVCDHDRPELGDVLTDALAYPARWIGVMGSPRHTGPHVKALQDRGVPEELIARVHRPIGLNIGSHTPAEIAISTLAGLIADRNARPGGFTFPKPA
jgi:xanthine/CO dehydrogenase XdhC/CoxF family maturation factor